MLLAAALALVNSAAAEPEFHVEATSQIMPQTVALDLRGRVDGEHDGYVTTVVRIDPTGTWIGRAGIGLDVFGGKDGVDLKLGLFLGGTGDVTQSSMLGRPTAGAEVLFGLNIGRVYGWYRHTDGFAGPLEDRLTEDELRLGFEITELVRVHGQYLIYNPGDQVVRGGAGVGVEVVF
ncbi:MAG: hypothetical protein Q8P41_24005 [Pseudomonadota bacterium]|nr:hypothetical protein [Pseudomonadota bacterium]